MSKFNFSFRRSQRKAFKNIAHGLIPAATIAPKPAVPRTPPPRSPSSSPERPRSALAAAILTSSLTGRTIAIPPLHSRSYSDSDCSHTNSRTNFEPHASTALYTRDQWLDSEADRSCLLSPQSGDDNDDNDKDEEKELEAGMQKEESHVFQSVKRQSRTPVPVKKAFAFQSKLDDDTDNSTFEVVSPLNTEDVKEDMHIWSPSSSPPKRKSSMKKSPAREREKLAANEAYHRAVELQQELLNELRELREQNYTLTAQKEALERTCSEQNQQVQLLHQQLSNSPRDRQQSIGESSELLSLRQQAQELVDENDGLKMTVHRLNVELSRYQARFRPLTRDESDPKVFGSEAGPAPPASFGTHRQLA
ncbi:Centrosomal protein of 89 kDa [Bagarius yarrelli]|uniref:Centrosomal protein of 89 kDa n=1 Tax=Bagarius yarrelli TaxID=175774 RepID=A0A556VVR2_BAGYA|nr:Centrosomal protein of 89 kDa [Bagarius yarrelli]